MAHIVDQLRRAGEELGVEVLRYPIIDLDDGTSISPCALVVGVGSKKGMLIFLDYSQVKPVLNSVRNSGFGFSILPEPREDVDFDISSFESMFLDWGWKK
ncbi:hypothetical protein [Arenimonas caeni]|jgi:hypothetical protein|uniref:hypothetical protein n=1 Tax=Arenimonas caeni TaxID=2058085 RepID=UPI0013B06A42|nr:hypothetical protein [Arenimonas caeni]